MSNTYWPGYLPPELEPGTTALQQAKHWLIVNLGLEKDALHVYLALILVFGSAWAFKWSLKSWKPPALVFVVALIGEIWDIRDGLRTSVTLATSWPWSVHDLINTMVWPIAIMLLARYSPVFRDPQG